MFTRFDDADVRQRFWAFCNERHTRLEDAIRRCSFTWIDSQRSTGAFADGSAPSTYDVTTSVSNYDDYYLLDRVISQTGSRYIFAANPRYTFTISTKDGKPWSLVEVGRPTDVIKPYVAIFGCLLSMQLRIVQSIEEPSYLFKSFEPDEFEGQPCFKLVNETKDGPMTRLESYFSAGEFGECLAQRGTFKDGEQGAAELIYDRSMKFPLIQKIKYVMPKAVRNVEIVDFKLGNELATEKCFLTYYGFPEPKTGASTSWPKSLLWIGAITVVGCFAAWLWLRIKG